jgi:hypothetical protein
VLFNSLEDAADDLNKYVAQRNSLVERFKDIDGDRREYLYFGTPQATDGIVIVNREYPDALEAICAKTNETIFFGVQLCQELTQHGNYLAGKAGKFAPKIAEVNFEIAKQEGLLPDDGDYASWFNSFKKK